MINVINSHSDWNKIQYGCVNYVFIFELVILGTRVRFNCPMMPSYTSRTTRSNTRRLRKRSNVKQTDSNRNSSGKWSGSLCGMCINNKKITVFQTLHFLLPREVLLDLKCERSLLILQVIDYNILLLFARQMRYIFLIFINGDTCMCTDYMGR